MLGTPHGQDPSIGSTIRHDRVGPTYPFGEADRPDFAVITTVVPSPPPAPRRRPPSPRWRCRRAAIPAAPARAARTVRVHLGVCGDDPPLGDQPRPHLLRVGAVERCQRRDGRRLSDRLDDPPAGHIGQRGAGRVAQLRQPRADPIRAGCQVFAERDRIPHARSDIGVRRSPAAATRSTADPSPAAAAAVAALSDTVDAVRPGGHRPQPDRRTARQGNTSTAPDTYRPTPR